MQVNCRRTVLHVDVDAFYVAAERSRNPDLAGRPVAVSQYNSGGFVAVSHEAREAGIRKGDGVGDAGRAAIRWLRENKSISVEEARRKCPSLVVLPMDTDYYRYFWFLPLSFLCLPSTNVYAHGHGLLQRIQRPDTRPPIALPGRRRRRGEGLVRRFLLRDTRRRPARLRGRPSPSASMPRLPFLFLFLFRCCCWSGLRWWHEFEGGKGEGGGEGGGFEPHDSRRGGRGSDPQHSEV